MDSLKNLTETFVVEIKTSYVGGPPPHLGIFRPFLSGQMRASGEAVSGCRLPVILGEPGRRCELGVSSFGRWPHSVPVCLPVPCSLPQRAWHPIQHRSPRGLTLSHFPWKSFAVAAKTLVDLKCRLVRFGLDDPWGSFSRDFGFWTCI